MNARFLLVALLQLALGACTHAYAPNEYPLTADRIPKLHASAAVSVVNVQQRGGEELLFALGAQKYVGDHREITMHFAEQLSRSLQQAGVQVLASGAPKRLDVSIVSISASPAYFHFKAKAVIAVMTGDNQRFEFVANNSTGGNIYRALNGVLAIAVLETMKHPGVQTYLVAPVGTPVPPAPASPAGPSLVR
jgi:hypothetical protein